MVEKQGQFRKMFPNHSSDVNSCCKGTGVSSSSPRPTRKDPRAPIQPQAKLHVLIKDSEGIWRGTDTSRVIPLPSSGGSVSLLPQGTFPVSTEGSPNSSQASSGSFYPGGIPWLLLPRHKWHMSFRNEAAANGISRAIPGSEACLSHCSASKHFKGLWTASVIPFQEPLPLPGSSC